jgi:hypothetical protein
MANEAVIIELLGNAGDPIRYTIGNATALSKGCIVKVTDPRTVAASTAADEPIVGIVAHEKVASDDSVTVTVYTNLIADMKDAGAGIAVGVVCAIGGANLIVTADANDLIQGSTVGQTLETIGAGLVGAVRILK